MTINLSRSINFFDKNFHLTHVCSDSWVYWGRSVIKRSRASVLGTSPAGWAQCRAPFWNYQRPPRQSDLREISSATCKWVLIEQIVPVSMLGLPGQVCDASPWPRGDTPGPQAPPLWSTWCQGWGIPSAPRSAPGCCIWTRCSHRNSPESSPARPDPQRCWTSAQSTSLGFKRSSCRNSEPHSWLSWSGCVSSGTLEESSHFLRTEYDSISQQGNLYWG